MIQSVIHIRSERRPYLLGALIVSLLIVMLAAIIVRDEIRIIETRNKTYTVVTAHLIAQHIEDILNRADVVLKTVAYEYAERQRLGHLDAQRFNAYLTHLRESSLAFPNIRVVDEQGNVRYGDGELPKVNLSDREDFIRARDMPDGSAAQAASIYVGPLRSTVSQRLVLVIARRLEHPDGRFAGLAYTYLDTDFFQKVSQEIGIEQGGTIALRTADLRQVDRYPRIDGSQADVGNTAVSQTLRDAVRTAPQGGVYTALAPIDGVRRHYAYRKTGPFPFYVLVGLPEVRLFNSWGGSFYWLMALASVLLALTWFAALSLCRRATLRVQAREAEQAGQILAASPVPVLLLDRALRIRLATPAALALFGYRDGELEGKPAASLVAARSLNLRPFDRLCEILNGAVSERWIEFFGLDRQGLEIALQAKSAQVQLGDQRFVIVVLEDIRERQRMEAERHALLELQGAILRQSPYAIVTTDPAGLITLFNPAAERLLGYAAEELVGREPLSLLYPQNHPLRYHPIDEAFALLQSDMSQGGVHSSELALCRKDGSSVFVLQQLSALHDEIGQTTGYLAMLQDVTELKEQAAALLQAKEAADAANRAKSEFLANMSHEIRTPMNAIIGLTALLLETELSERQREQLLRVHRAGQALLQLLNDILDYSKIEAGQLRLEQAPFELSEVVELVHDLFAHRIQEKNLAWEVEIDPALPSRLLGDSLRLGQILINLVGNAVKFTDSGSIRLALRCKQIEGDKVVLLGSVSDTGVGMDEAQVGQLFGAFTQADSSITRKYGGTGLGLFIVRRLVALMGGEIQVRSSLGQGSCFEFSVCLQRLSAAPVAENVALAAKRAQAANPLPLEQRAHAISGSKVLVVDDVEANLILAQGALAKMGVQAVCVSSAEDALLAAQRDSFDAILMDLKMDDMDGFTAARHLKASLGAACPPVIALTALVLPQDRQAALEAGMVDYLSKPYTLDQLFECLARWIAPHAKAAARSLNNEEKRCLAERIVELRKQLQGRRLRAKQVCEEIVAMLQGSQFESDFRPVAEAVRALQFQQALTRLDNLALGELAPGSAPAQEKTA